MLRKMKRALLWALVNGAMAAMLYAATVKNIAGAENVVVFVTWLNAVCALGLLSDEFVVEMRARGEPSVPYIAHIVYDIAFVIALAWFGWWWTASAFVFATISQERLYAKPKTA